MVTVTPPALVDAAPTTTPSAASAASTAARADGVDDDHVFRALADPGRRRLLDALHERDARTLGELCDVLDTMSRFGVMKHLGVLEEAGLVVTERHGRSKLHYLNPVPIQRMHDRWISKYAAPLARAMTDLHDLEGA